MSTFPNTPAVLKGGLVLLDADTGAVLRTVSLQYNPDSVTRSLQPLASGENGEDRSEVLRLKGPPVETIKLEAAIDATDALEFPERTPSVVEFGIQPQLAALEAILYPPSQTLQSNDALAQAGVLEIVPVTAPLTLFVWSKSRVVPVRITELSITEEAFDTLLNPIRAKVSLGLRVLTSQDLGLSGRAGSLYLAYQKTKERLATLVPGPAIGRFGLAGL